MDTKPNRSPEGPPRAPWNKGKMIGSKPPLRTKNVWSIRTKLQIDGRLRDLAMFNVASYFLGIATIMSSSTRAPGDDS